jgi:hypothetical protein
VFTAFADRWFAPLVAEHQHFEVARLSDAEVHGLLASLPQTLV